MEIIARGQITIWNYKDGDDAYSVILNHDTHAVACDPSGNALSGELGPSGKAVFALSAYRGATKLTMRYSSAASTAGMCAWKFGTISGCTAVQVSGSNEKFYINTMTVDSAYVEIVCSVDGKASITKRVTVVKQKKGDTGDPGKPGDDGKQGCMLRPRGTWTAQTQYVYNDQYRDVVIHNNSVYIVKATHTSAVSFDSSKWEPFNEFINVATSVLLANKGYIDVLGAARLFVGDTNKSTGWEMTNGYIKHTKSGLTLTADGKLYDPDGLHLFVGGKTVQAIVDGAVDSIQVSGRNIVKNSDFSQGTSGWNLNQTTAQVKTDSVYGTYLEFKHAGVGDIAGNRISQAPFYTGLWHEVGKTYSLSFYAKAAKAVTIKAGEAYNLNSFAVTTQWKRYTVTYVAKNAGSLTINIAEANVLLSLTQIKLEEGTKATDWSPSPEDVKAKFEKNSSDIAQLPDQITLTVRKEISGGGLNYITNTQSAIVVTGENKANQVILNDWIINRALSGKKYGAAFKVKFTGCTFTSSSRICLQTSNIGGWAYNGLTASTVVSANKEYVIYRNTNTAPTLTGDGPAQIRIDYVSGGKITISEIRAYDVPDDGLTDPMPWYPSKWDTEVLSSEIKQTAESISLKVNQAIGGENLIDNSSFSQNLNGWSLNGDGSVMTAKIVNTTALGGTCLELWFKSNGYGIFRNVSEQGKSYVRDGEVFTISFDLYKTTAYPYALLVGFEDDGMGEGNTLNISNHPLNTWKRVSVTQTLKTSRAVIVIYGSGGTAGAVYIKNLKVERGSIATPWIASGDERLLATGIDIQNGQITFTANKTFIQDNNGNPIAMFTNIGERPLIDATNIDVDNLKVKHLDGADGTFSGSLSAATGTFKGSLSAATGTFEGDLNAAGGSFKGSVTANGARIGGFTIQDNVIKSNIINAGISFSNGDKGEMTNLFSNRVYTQSIWVDDGVNNYHPIEKEFTIRTNRTCNMITPGAGTNLFIADMMNLRYKTLTRSGRYGLQYAMMGSGHIVQDGVIDGGCWYKVPFSKDKEVHIITPFDNGNRVCVTTEYNGDILVLPSLDKMLQMLGVGIATRVGPQFSFGLTIVNASSKTVYVMGKADFTVGDVSFNFDQYPTFYNASGTLINSENGFTLAAHRSRQFILTYDGTNYMAFEL